MTISAERERQLLASAANPSDALRAIQFLLTRVRALEAQAELAESFVEVCEVCGCEDGCECPARVRELEKREAELTELLRKTDVLLDQLEASDELSESYETGVAEVHLPIIVALKE